MLLGCALLSFVDNVVYGCYEVPLRVLRVDALVYAGEKLEDELWKLVGHPFTDEEMRMRLFMFF